MEKNSRYSEKKYIDYYGVKTGENISLFTNNDSAYETAISLNKSGVKVKVIIDIRENSNSILSEQVEKSGIKILKGYTVIDTDGYKRIKSFDVMKLSKDGGSVVGNNR